MAKSANLYARIEPEVKEQAEAILSALGIPASNAITMFYKQVILQRGLPFEVKLPEHPLDVSRMTAEQLDTELEKGYAQMKAGQTIPAKQAFDGLHVRSLVFLVECVLLHPYAPSNKKMPCAFGRRAGWRCQNV